MMDWKETFLSSTSNGGLNRGIHYEVEDELWERKKKNPG